MIDSLQFCQLYKGNVNSVMFPHSEYKWDDEIIRNFNHVLNTRKRFIIACHLIFSFTCYKQFLSLLMFINCAYLHSLLIYWHINIPDLTIQGIRAVKIYDLFQFFYFHFMCLLLFHRSDLGEYLKMNVEDTKITLYSELLGISSVFSSWTCIWVYSRGMIMRRKISKHTQDYFHKKCKFEHPVLWSYMQKKFQTTTNNKWAATLKPWHTKNLQKRPAKVQIQPNIFYFLYVRTFRLAGMKSVGTFLYFR